MPIDVERVREDTPGCAHVTHLNSAGAALPPRPVTEAVIGHLRLEERIGGYEAHADQADRLGRCYDSVARLIGADPTEIALTENATRAWDMAFYSIPWSPGDRILTARAEYASNAIAYLQVARRHGVTVDPVPDDEHGQLDVAALREMIDDRVKLIAVTHVPSQGGLVNPAVEIGAVAREAGVLYLLDACQSVGQLPVDVREIGCDLLSATGRKFLRAPRGTGFLYCSARVLDRLEPPFLDLHAATWTGTDTYQMCEGARRFETWEAGYAGRLGLGVAIDYALDLGMDAIERRVVSLAQGLRARLRSLPGVRVHDQGSRRCGIVTFTVDGHDSHEIGRALREKQINVTATGVTTGRWDLEPRGLGHLVRASTHYYNTEDDLDVLCEALPTPRP